MNYPQKSNNTPLYRQVEHYILDEIDPGRLTPGDLIPSEPQLSSLLNVRQGTVKKH
jgi:GntR family transcriptional regulator